MAGSLGTSLSSALRRWIPEPFVFALLLTVLVGSLAWILTDAGPTDVVEDWYRGFWVLLEFGMQMVLILTTGYAIALSAVADRAIDRLSRLAATPGAVYVLVMVAGGLFTLVSWGWVVLTAVLARALARRVEGVDYAYLVACVYISSQPWVGGLSSSIPLLLNTDGNFLIETGALAGTIPIVDTLGSRLNLAYVVVSLTTVPALIWWLRPAPADAIGMAQLTDTDSNDARSVSEQARAELLDGRCVSDRLNSSAVLQGLVAAAALWFVVRHFAINGLDLDLNIMTFSFLALGMLAHRTPMRYVVAMRRACSNVSGIIFQYPFYAGIMGMMMFSGLGGMVAEWAAGHATLTTLPLLAQASGALVNFAIPSAGGEWAVIGPSLTDTALRLSADMPPDQSMEFVARVAMAVAYGETSTNALQPFFLLAVLPVMGAGVRVRARDVMGYLVLPFLWIYAFTAVILRIV